MSQLENINNSSSLQEILFNMLLNDLQEQSDYLNKLLELFLAHTCKTDTSCKNDSINEFVNIHVAEATKHLESGFFEDQKQEWWHEMSDNRQKTHKLAKRTRYFKNLSNGIKRLYVLIRHSLNLQSDQFLSVEYPNLKN